MVNRLAELVFLATALLLTASNASPNYEPTPLPSGIFGVVSTRNSEESMVFSPNGQWSATPVSTVRTAEGFDLAYSLQIRKNQQPIFTLSGCLGIPTLSATGYTFIAREGSPDQMEIVSPSGETTFSAPVKKTVILGFSVSGDYFAYVSDNETNIISCKTGEVSSFPASAHFATSEDGQYIALVATNDENAQLTIYKQNKLLVTKTLKTPYIRGIDIRSKGAICAVAEKSTLSLISLENESAVQIDSLDDSEAFMDLQLGDDVIWAGVRSQNEEHTEFRGILRTYSFNGKLLSAEEKSSRSEPITPLSRNYREGEIPWPFAPQDKIHDVWNGYLALSGSQNSSSGSYLHQGLDMDVPANARTLSCTEGFVKCFLYIMEPAYLYWRVAVSEVNVATESDGWLYAHLIKETVPVKPGDKVKVGQHVGDIVKWDALSSTGNARGHIHFSRIRDKGLTWKYDDGEWKNVCDPLSKLRPYGDVSAPKFLEPEPGSLFLFSTNDGLGTPTYLKPLELKGSIDIIVKMTDMVGTSKWDQPAHAIHYWINDTNGKTVLPRKIGIVRNWVMPDYSGDLYYSLPPVMYRMDSKCPMKSSWTEQNRLFYHVITNNNNDSMITMEDQKEALDTKKFGDGNYWIVVEMSDVAGNIAIDSQKVFFKNGIIVNLNTSQVQSGIEKPQLHQMISGNLQLVLPNSSFEPIQLDLFGLNGRIVHSQRWNSGDGSLALSFTPAPGFYSARIQIGNKKWNQSITCH